MTHDTGYSSYPTTNMLSFVSLSLVVPQPKKHVRRTCTCAGIYVCTRVAAVFADSIHVDVDVDVDTTTVFSRSIARDWSRGRTLKRPLPAKLIVSVHLKSQA